MKFHPGIFDLRACIGSVGGQKDFVMHGNHWKTLQLQFQLKTYLKITKQIGKSEEINLAVSREELIDNSDYWNLVQALLARHTNLSFHYTGRKPVHHKWAQPKSAVINRIKFLGWLQSPETKLTEYAFLLDPTPWVTVIWLGRLLRLLSQLSIKRKASSRPHAPFINC